jgi:alpha-L-arabinofuranosidase
MGHRRLFLGRFAAILCLMFMTVAAHAQQVVYDDALENGWQNWSWASTSLTNTSPVHSGSDSVSVSFTGAFQAFYVHNNAFNASAYSAITFWINGGATGGQQLTVEATLNGVSQTAVSIGTLPGGSVWTQETIPLSALGVANATNMDGFWIQETSGRATVPTMYVDDISLTPAPPPNPVNVAINAASPVRTLNTRLLGLNTAIWDSTIGSSPTQSLIAAAKFQILRYPGGSASDAYNWSTNISDGDTFTWPGGTGQFTQLMLGSGATGLITTNYGKGTPPEAAAWVAYFDGSPSSTQVIGTDAK